jgi:hypothetical protein
MRRASKFNKSDITRATKAVREAGLEIARVEVAQGGVTSWCRGARQQRTKMSKHPRS